MLQTATNNKDKNRDKLITYLPAIPQPLLVYIPLFELLNGIAVWGPADKSKECSQFQEK